jgi:tetratricopeptide (TPR) repeat protein
LFWEWNLAEAEREFNRAIALDPTYATAHHWQAIYLAILAGDSNGAVIAITKMQQALELEPLSPVINADLGQVFYFARRYDEAIAACQKALAIDPDFINAHFYLYDIYTQKEMYGEAIEEFFRVAQRPGEISPQAMNALRNAYETEGIRGFWKERIKVLNRHPLDEYRLARYYARLGEKDRAIEWLEKAYESRAFVFIYAKADPVFEELQPDARFQNLMRRLEAIGNRPPASQ